MTGYSQLTQFSPLFHSRSGILLSIKSCYSFIKTNQPCN